MSEALITAKTKKCLKQYELDGLPIYFNKISDRFTSGIPDYQGTFYGVSFYIELKDKGKEPGRLQAWHLRRAHKAGAMVLSTDCFGDVFNFLERIRTNHEHIVKARYV